MKDPKYTTASSDTLAFRMRLGQAASSGLGARLPQSPPVEMGSATRAVSAMPVTCRMTRSSAEDMNALRNMPCAGIALLFTPVLTPAGSEKAAIAVDFVDPFESFGRALSQQHKRIRHVPYVPKIGFTEIHETFVSQADAVFIVICEPDKAKNQSVGNQIEFAESALDALEGKEASAAGSLVLVQCGSDEHRPPVDEAFINLVETSPYNNDVAELLVQTIFQA